MKLRLQVCGIVLIGLILSGCQTTSFALREHLWTDETGRKVLLLPTDIELSVLNAGGVKEPNAEWTEKANKFALAALREKIQGTSAKLVEYDKSKADSNSDSEEVQLLKLHEVVGGSIVAHKFLPAFQLPTKQDSFDWTLSPAVKTLRDKYGADYGLFVFVRDSYTSGGRAAVILLAAVLSVNVQGGTQGGFASLVDLRTGEIVWFNLLARGHGDMRNQAGATETITALMENFPK